MFPIPFNFPFRKKDGSITTMDDAISSGGGSYTLPTASADTKGGVKVGVGLTMDGETLKNTNPTPYSLPIASAETLGGVKVGEGLTIDNGVLSASGGSGGGLSYADIPINVVVSGGLDHMASGSFQPTSDMVGKHIVSALKLEGSGVHTTIYCLGCSRMSDPIADTDWIYALFFNNTDSTNTGTVTKVRVFYT